MSELDVVRDNYYCYQFIITIDLYCYAVSVIIDLCFCWSDCFIAGIQVRYCYYLFDAGHVIYNISRDVAESHN